MTPGRAAPGTVYRVEDGMFDRLRRVDPRIWDALLAAAMIGWGILVFVFREPAPNEPPAFFGYALIAVSGASLAWRRRAPLVVLVVVAVAVSVASLAGWWDETFYILWVALYTAAAYRERRRLLPVLVPVVVVVAVSSAIGEHTRTHGAIRWSGMVGDLALIVIPALLGRMTFNRRRRIARERQVASEEAVVAERARIARELHDVVAHHLSVMVVQAEAARAVGERDPAAADEALRQIEASGRTGLAEMRRLLEILKSQGEADGREPQPGLAQLDDLIEGMRSTGILVEAEVAGAPRPLPPGVDLSAYRIVQEALTNTLKHAGGARAHVLVRYDPNAVEVEVVDDGPGPPAAADANGAATGHGLIGMRERMQLFGGELDAGPRPGGGFRVWARLPAETVA
jgi:signal transduction histidine kinase